LGIFRSGVFITLQSAEPLAYAVNTGTHQNRAPQLSQKRERAHHCEEGEESSSIKTLPTWGVKRQSAATSARLQAHSMRIAASGSKGNCRALDVLGKQVCDTVSELASGTYEELGWPELLPFVFQCVQSDDTRLQESSLLIFAQLAHHIMGTLRQYMGTLHEILARTLTSPNRDVALASMRATAAFVQACPFPWQDWCDMLGSMHASTM
jgi:hypothetical protein